MDGLREDLRIPSISFRHSPHLKNRKNACPRYLQGSREFQNRDKAMIVICYLHSYDLNNCKDKEIA